jgi:hypothetical protein
VVFLQQTNVLEDSVNMKIAFVFVFALLFLSGCVSYSYTGKTAVPDGRKVVVFSDSGKISKPYTVLGTAVVSGNYQQVSRDRMLNKLLDEAKKSGADAVLIVEQQVLPETMLRQSRGGFFTAYDYDSTNHSWGELYRDVDITIGNIGQKNASSSSPAISDYRRVIRAEFLRYNDDKKAAAPAKVTAAPKK